LALIAYSGIASNILTYDLALVTNARNFSSPAVKALHWNEWVVDENSLRPDLANTSGIFRPYPSFGAAAKAPLSPLQEIDANAVQIYYDTSKIPRNRILLEIILMADIGVDSDPSTQGDNAGKPLADVHFVKVAGTAP
jgi:hypothetical protein